MASLHNYGDSALRMLKALRRRGLLNDDAFAAHLHDATGAEIHPSLVSQWLSGSAHLPAAVLPHLCDFIGDAALVLGPIAREAGHRVVAEEATPAPDAVVSAGAVTGHAADYLRALLAALRDGRIDPAEREQLLAILRELVGEAEASAAGLRVAR